MLIVFFFSIVDSLGLKAVGTVSGNAEVLSEQILQRESYIYVQTVCTFWMNYALVVNLPSSANKVLPPPPLPSPSSLVTVYGLDTVYIDIFSVA